MAHKKAGGSVKNQKDSNPKYLGIKVSDGALASAGSILVRQRGTKIIPGKNVGIGKDHTLFALLKGTARFKTKRKTDFRGKTIKKKILEVISSK